MYSYLFHDNSVMCRELGSNFITSINATDLQGFSNLETLYVVEILY